MIPANVLGGAVRFEQFLEQFVDPRVVCHRTSPDLRAAANRPIPSKDRPTPGSAAAAAPLNSLIGSHPRVLSAVFTHLFGPVRPPEYPVHVGPEPFPLHAF